MTTIEARSTIMEYDPGPSRILERTDQEADGRSTFPLIGVT